MSKLKIKMGERMDLKERIKIKEKNRNKPKEYGIKTLEELKEELKKHNISIINTDLGTKINIDARTLGELVGDLIELTYVNDKPNLFYIGEILERENIPFFQHGMGFELGWIMDIKFQDKVLNYLIREYDMGLVGGSLIYKTEND